MLKIYDPDISAATLSAITDKVIPLVEEWQSRSLEAIQFKQIMEIKQGCCLQSWMEQAVASEIAQIKSFAGRLRSDMETVKNALTTLIKIP